MFCKICDKEIDKALTTFISIHLPKEHNITGEEYYRKFFKKEGEGICHCEGCKNPTKYKNFTEGYGNFCSRACTSRGTKDNRIQNMGTSKRENNWDDFVEKLKNKKIKPLFTKEVFVNRETENYEYKCLECNNTFKINNTTGKMRLKEIKCYHCTSKDPNSKRNIEQYNQKFKCLVCNKEMEGTSQFFVSHIEKYHAMSSKDYYDTYLKKEGEGICQKEGCNNLTKFNRFSKGYDKHCSQQCAASDEKTREIFKNSMTEQWGVDNPLKCKIIMEKKEKTCLEKYGFNNAAKHPDTINKMAATNMEVRGYKTPGEDPVVQQKTAETCFERYGEKAPALADSVKQKIKKRHKEKSGYDNVFSSPEYKNIIKNYYKENFGCDYASQVPEYIFKAKKTKKKKYWDIYALKLDKKKIKPLFDEDFYINNDEFEFECLRCGKKFKTDKTEAYSINCGCLLRRSHFEDEIADELIKIGIDTKNIIKNRWFYIGKKRLQLDLYLTEYKIGIEYCGFYWHSELYAETNEHLNKHLFFKQLGIPVIQIFENEWQINKETVLSIIKSKINKSERIYARECEIKDVSLKDYQMFLITNHLQGSVPSPIKLGLYYNNELVSLMGLGTSRYNKSYEYEIYRFCTKINFCVIGGFSRLLKHFEEKYKPKSIISYIDIRYFNGKSYEKNEFKFLHLSVPVYYYFKRNKPELYNRIIFQKHKLKDKLDNFDPNKTEHKNMLENNYLRIYDAGNLVYVKEYNYNDKSVII
jgi:DNA-directed RNA polymerase subunit RPC12/RpoP